MSARHTSGMKNDSAGGGSNADSGTRPGLVSFVRRTSVGHGNTNAALDGGSASSENQPVEGDTEDTSKPLSGSRLDVGTHTTLDHSGVTLAETSQAIELTSGEVAREFAGEVEAFGQRAHDNQRSRDNLRCQTLSVTTQVVGETLSDVSRPMSRLDRFEAIIAEFGPTNADFARRVSRDPKHINTILSRLRQKPNDAGLDGETVASIMKTIGVSPLWLMFGEGPKLLDVAEGDPELTHWLGRMPEALRRAASDEALRISEAKTLMRLFEQKSLRTFASGDDGETDWTLVIRGLRAGQFAAKPATVAGMVRASEELGKQPAKFLPEGEKGRKRKR